MTTELHIRRRVFALLVLLVFLFSLLFLLILADAVAHKEHHNDSDDGNQRENDMLFRVLSHLGQIHRGDLHLLRCLLRCFLFSGNRATAIGTGLHCLRELHTAFLTKQHFGCLLLCFQNHTLSTLGADLGFVADLLSAIAAID